MGCPGGCSGGSGTNGRGRTPYTPSKTSPFTSGGVRNVTSGGGKTTDRKASEFGTPKVKASFSRRK